MPALRPLGFKIWSFWGLSYLLARTLCRYFLTGHPISGDRRDNATLFHAATKDYRDKPLEQLSGPLWQRLARRWVALGVPLGFLELSVAARVVAYIASPDPAWTHAPWLLLAYVWWVACALSALIWGGRRAIHLLRHRKTINEFVYPTWYAASKVLGVAYHHRDARRNVFLPDGFEPGDGTEVDGPAQHGRLARWSGAARLLDRRAARKETQQQARLAAEQARREAEDETEPAEPDTVPSTDLVVRDRPGWLVYTDRFRRQPVRTGSTAAALEEPVRICLPPGRIGTDAQKKAFLNAVGPVLGIEPDPDWQLSGNAPYVLLRPTRLPPTKVTFDDVKQYFEASTLSRPFVGLAAGGPGGAGRPVYLDLDHESPHTLRSGGTGTGKSTLLKTPLPIRMHLGAGLIIGDFKRVSHLWAHNLPGCVYAWKIEQIHNVFVAAGQELMARIDGVLPETYDHTIELTRFQVWDIVVEEINSLTPMLQRYWQGIRGPKDPVPSPAITAIQQIIFMGREMGMHVWVGSQRAAANVFGGDGGSTRENFASRLMAKWTKQTWAMLAGGIPWMKCPKGGRGIWTLVQGDEADIIRVPYLTNAEARAWAMSGVPSPPTPLDTHLTVEQIGPDVPSDAPELVTLSRAIDFLPGPPMSLPALRQASHRPGFPEKAGEDRGARTYELAALVVWKQELDSRKGLEESWELPAARREAWVYRFDVLDPESGAVVCGYVGQTHWLEKRERQHRADKPWADLIVGSIQPIWHSDACTPQELDEQELHFIHTLLPLYNIEGQEGAAHAVPKWTQIEQRQERQKKAGLPPWEPVDTFNEPAVI